MVNQEPRKRWISPVIEAALADTPVVVLNGARQVGKTTLTRLLSYPGTTEFATLDDPVTRAAARQDPRAFVRRRADTFVIDEVQLEPSIFRTIKAEVDRDRRPGRFLLTGSSRLLSAPDMAESLVGRTEAIELWPFSQGELEGRRDQFIDRCFAEPSSLIRSGVGSRSEAIERICRGGFPDVVGRNESRRGAWFESYVTTTVAKVVRELADVERSAEIPTLLRLCAARTGTELNSAEISNQLGFPARTGAAYLARLNTAFLVQTLPAWSTNLSAKVVRRPKLNVIDTGLAAHMIGSTPSRLTGIGDVALGQLLETFVANELRNQVTWSTERVSLWHFRDRGGAEVDIVIEHPDGTVVGIEVKATSTPTTSDFGGLRFLESRLGPRFRFGAVLCLAAEATPFGPRLAALPVERLWS